MFTSVEIFPNDATDHARGSIVAEPGSPAVPPPSSLSEVAGWRLTAMPPGFEVVATATQPSVSEGPDRMPDRRSERLLGRTAEKQPDEPGSAGPAAAQDGIEATILQHLVVSDGVATVSVYVESGAEGALDGAMRMGATTVVGSPIGAHHATVVGEVPERTARMLLDGLTPPDANDADRERH
jgi:negative regulator of sigma E activity